MTEASEDADGYEGRLKHTATNPSPEATGGAGASYEIRVGAIVLARLVRGDRLEGLGLPIRRVGFQERYAGHVLDDVVVEGIDSLNKSRVVEYQAKRRVSPAPSDPDFVETIQRCLEAIRDDVNGEIASRRRRFGLVSNPSGPLRDLARVTEVARSHDHASSFLDVVRTTANAGVRQRLEQLRQTVHNLLSDPDDQLSPDPSDSDVDGFTWQIARALYLWELDAEPSGASVLATLDRLDDLTRGFVDAATLFEALIQLVRDWAPQAASVDLPMVQLALETQGFALDQAPARAAEFQALLAASYETLDTGIVRLGRQLLLPRLDLRATIADAVAQNNATVLSGRAGVGKSMLSRLVAEDLRAEGAIVVGLSLTGRAGTLSTLEADLDVRLRDGLAGAPIGTARVLLIDGAEQALADAGALLKAILAALPTTAAGAPPWRVLLTARDEAASTVLALVRERIDDPVRLPVGELSDEEIDQVLEAFPVLQPLRRNRRAESLLLRRPYLIELLIRSTVVEDLPAELVGEEDLMEVVTTRLVRRDNGGLTGVGEPDARSDIYLDLAAAAIAATLPSLLTGRDAEARRGLYGDDVIAPTRPTQLSWRFAHDVLVDYAVATRLLEPGGSELLGAAPNPRRLLRAVRLRMQRSLADACIDGSVVDAWIAVVSDADQLVARDGERWRDVPYEALLHLGAARTALAQLVEVLLGNEGAGLLRLVDVAERLARVDVINDRRGPIALDIALTGPVVDLLGSLTDHVPTACRPRATRLVHHHLAAAFERRGDPEAGLDNAAKLPKALISWAGDAAYGQLLELSLGSLGFLGVRLDADDESFLICHASDRPDDVSEVVESPGSSAAMAASRPDLMLRLAGLYYLGRGLTIEGTTDERGRRPRSRFAFGTPFGHFEDDDDLGEEGVRDHDPKHSKHLDMFPLGNNQANPALGPFRVLLAAHDAEGLRLIGAIVDAATVARQRLEAGFSSDQPAVTLELTTNESPTRLEFSGPATVWCWHRRTTVGPGPAQSALMALREWASALIARGIPIAVVRDQILDSGQSLAFVAVAWFVMLEHLDSISDEMDPFLVHREVWSLEIMRRVHEAGGTALVVPEVTRLDWMVSQVAMQLVLRGDNERCDRLAELGRQLIENAHTSGYDDLAVVRRWASELDIDNYRAEPQEEGIAISVEYDPEVLAVLAQSGSTAQQGLNGAGLMFRAAAMRDGTADLGEAEALWDQIDIYVHTLTASGLYDPRDLSAAAAAGLVRAARDGIAVDDSAFAKAVTTLLEYASHIARTAPPELSTLTSPNDASGEVDDISTERVIRETFWDQGYDRSQWHYRGSWRTKA